MWNQPDHLNWDQDLYSGSWQVEENGSRTSRTLFKQFLWLKKLKKTLTHTHSHQTSCLFTAAVHCFAFWDIPLCFVTERSNWCSMKKRVRAFCTPEQAALHNSHHTSAGYFIFYLLNVYMCILSCNIFWRFPVLSICFTVLIFFFFKLSVLSNVCSQNRLLLIDLFWCSFSAFIIGWFAL